MGDALRWLNTSGETIPAYGVVQLRDNYASGYNQASKPNSSSGLFFVNGPVAVLDTKKGESQLWNRPRLALVSGSPTVGTQVGPVEDSWEMSEEGTGFFVIHQPVGGVATVERIGGGGGGTHEVWFRIESVICNDDASKTLYVTPFLYTGPCGSSIPGLDEYGQLEVNDPCSILVFYTSLWLETGGVVGRATMMNPVGAEYCEPDWYVDTICGQPECV
jgi:hypothetical protein